jgi:16S rRNA (cytosine1402-N4)-methyltransferase
VTEKEVARHVPVLLEEAVQALAIRADGVYVDATFGRGGHSRRILHALGPAGVLVAIDRDRDAVDVASALGDPRVRPVHAAFSGLRQVLVELRLESVDGVLCDLGVSSPQFDEAARGFSFRFDAPLDMRMDRSAGMTAAEWLAVASEEDIAKVIHEFGEERFSRGIARTVVAERATKPIATTGDLARLCARVVRTREPGQDPATRTFQALRIHVNRELDEVGALLPQAAGALAPHGRLAVISFHSLEDRIVKRFMRDESQPPEVPRGLAVREADRPTPRLSLVGKPIRPQPAEIAANPRSRSAVLRVAERRA